jgi:hypothetical protein
MDEAMHELGAATSSSMFKSILPVAGALQQALKKLSSPLSYSLQLFCLCSCAPALNDRPCHICCVRSQTRDALWLVARCSNYNWSFWMVEVSSYYSKVRPIQIAFDRPVVPGGPTSKERYENPGLRVHGWIFTCERRQERLVCANDAGDDKPGPLQRNRFRQVP